MVRKEKGERRYGEKGKRYGKKRRGKKVEKRSEHC